MRISHNRNKLAWAGIALVVILLVVGAAFFVRTIATDESAEISADAEASAEDLAGARAVLLDRFQDSTSITFGKVFVHGDGEARAVCGKVDIEQADDGFEGFERFVYLAGELALDETDGTDEVLTKWRDVCEG